MTIRILPNPALAGSDLLLAQVQADPRQIAYAARRQAHSDAWFASEKTRERAQHTIAREYLHWCWIRRIAT